MFQRIDKNTALEKLSNSKSVLLDIRDLASFEDGHAKDAIHLTEKNLPDFVANADKTAPTLVMCYHGNSSQMVAQYLNEQGFTDVYSIDGGYEEWKL